MSEWVSTKEAMKILGVGSTSIKRWADENKLRSIRTEGGHRRFDRAEIEGFLNKGRRANGQLAQIDRWIAVLSRTGDANRVCDEINNLFEEVGDWFEVADFLGIVIEQIGLRWATGSCSVIEEHVATSRLELALGTISNSMPVPRNAPICVLATLSGEGHSLGLSLTRLCLRSAGVEVNWIGTHVPLDQLLAYLATCNAQLVGLSASRWSTDYAFLGYAYKEIAAVCQDRNIDLMLGGAGSWPTVMDYGHHCYSFQALKRVMSDIELPSASA